MSEKTEFSKCLFKPGDIVTTIDPKHGLYLSSIEPPGALGQFGIPPTPSTFLKAKEIALVIEVKQYGFSKRDMFTYTLLTPSGTIGWTFASIYRLNAE